MWKTSGPASDFSSEKVKAGVLEKVPGDQGSTFFGVERAGCIFYELIFICKYIGVFLGCCGWTVSSGDGHCVVSSCSVHHGGFQLPLVVGLRAGLWFYISGLIMGVDSCFSS